MPKPIRNVFGIIAYVCSGFFFYAVNIVAFVNQPLWPIKSTIILVFAVPAILFSVIGSFCRGFGHFQRDLGIVLLSAAANSILVILSFVCMFASPELAKSLPPDTLQMFSAITFGAASLALYIFIGLGLLLMSRKKNGENSKPPVAN
jgi:hypothetical protein